MMVSTKRMDEMVTELREATAQLKALDERVSQLRADIKQALEDAGLKNFKGNDGTVTLAEKSTVKMPQDPLDRAKFIDYLDRKGLKDSMLTVNHNTLNSWYRAEEEAAMERGQLDFHVPGLPVPETYTELRFNKK